MSRAPFGTLPGEPEVLATIRHLRSEGVPRDEIQAALHFRNAERAVQFAESVNAKLELEQRFGPGAAA